VSQAKLQAFWVAMPAEQKQHFFQTFERRAGEDQLLQEQKRSFMILSYPKAFFYEEEEPSFEE
jgi:hypothetical protein